MKFSILTGCEEVKGSQSESLDCYVRAVQMAYKWKWRLVGTPEQAMAINKIKPQPDSVEDSIDLRVQEEYPHSRPVETLSEIGKTMEVYVDDMLIKSRVTSDHIINLIEIFDVLQRYKMKLNPLKCSFEVFSGKNVGGSDNISENDKEILDWKKRFNIAVGTAKGLAHLHDVSGKPRIVHRDVKSANILLDENWKVKVADFGLARSISVDKTHISTEVKGTFGYIDPDYFYSGNKLNEKADVYSFGMLLLELITGCLPTNKIQPSDSENLALKAKTMLRRAVKDNKINVVYTDPKLEKKFDNGEMFRMVHCAGACLCYSAKDRPRMSQILEALEGKLDVQDLTESIKTTLPEEYILRHNMKLLEMLEAIEEQDPASSSGIEGHKT
ncbi:proline-rich receptor-like protein kinase PERK15 [Pistacia vera]|uniref:proline-rich receptor-like protein kinase PERK15 n=1 Tax=Pistacia vera TaxID=55513 RepID=UPI001263AF26|nr:proline-rich receptor-like protein kinase PERK15 [Pistacia vera]